MSLSDIRIHNIHNMTAIDMDTNTLRVGAHLGDAGAYHQLLAVHVGHKLRDEVDPRVSRDIAFQLVDDRLDLSPR